MLKTNFTYFPPVDPTGAHSEAIRVTSPATCVNLKFQSQKKKPLKSMEKRGFPLANFWIKAKGNHILNTQYSMTKAKKIECVLKVDIWKILYCKFDCLSNWRKIVYPIINKRTKII